LADNHNRRSRYRGGVPERDHHRSTPTHMCGWCRALLFPFPFSRLAAWNVWLWAIQKWARATGR
jgi:hypothetical protein